MFTLRSTTVLLRLKVLYLSQSHARTYICRPSSFAICRCYATPSLLHSRSVGLDCCIIASVGTHKTLFLESHEVVDDGYYDLAQVLIGYE
ncbi:hypothetical protein LOK49_LG04G03512 [Camellia lanceoleosa]|uniref:Uncharacterized protein n=1 Tax=Camellia lanceoleosa TaxID=1840588 RepID=A0ACC0HYG8_9ERIC|nr:hypothetical protein LOK49_LG04G03512 [Camellia lanceoleosa]